jgi:hypothetical protein
VSGDDVALIGLTGTRTDPKTGNYISYQYAVQNHPKTIMVVQKSSDGYWYVFKVTGKKVVTVGHNKTEKGAKEECIRYAKVMM